MKMFNLKLISFILISAFNISCVSANDVLVNKMKKFSEGEGLKLEISTDKKQYNVEEPIVVQYVFKNTGNSIVNFREILFVDISFAVAYEGSQKKILDIRTLPNDVNKVQNIITIEAGKSYSEEWVINNIFYVMPKELGRYEMYVIYRNPLEKIKKTKLWTGKLKSNSIGFEIK